MSQVKSNLKYTQTHEWVRFDADQAVIGISDHAQEALGDIVFIELPTLGDEVEAGDQIAVVESVKAASDIYAPISGKVVAINDALEATPELVNQSPYDDGWFFALEPTDEGALLSAEEYEQTL